MVIKGTFRHGRKISKIFFSYDRKMIWPPFLIIFQDYLLLHKNSALILAGDQRTLFLNFLNKKFVKSPAPKKRKIKNPIRSNRLSADHQRLFLTRKKFVVGMIEKWFDHHFFRAIHSYFKKKVIQWLKIIRK